MDRPFCYATTHKEVILLDRCNFFRSRLSKLCFLHHGSRWPQSHLESESTDLKLYLWHNIDQRKIDERWWLCVLSSVSLWSMIMRPVLCQDHMRCAPPSCMARPQLDLNLLDRVTQTLDFPWGWWMMSIGYGYGRYDWNIEWKSLGWSRIWFECLMQQVSGHRTSHHPCAHQSKISSPPTRHGTSTSCSGKCQFWTSSLGNKVRVLRARYGTMEFHSRCTWIK